MEHPELRHFRNGLILSDPVEVLVGKAWQPAVLCQRDDGSQYWATQDMAKLPAVAQWRHAVKAGQKPASDLGEHPPGDQGRKTTKASGSNRVRQSRKKPQA